MPYYKLAFNKPLSQLYTYQYDIELPRFVRVEAFLGSRKYRAILVEYAPEEEVKELIRKEVNVKSIVRVIDEAPLLIEEQYNLALWMSEYYLASLGECLFTMMPSGKREKDHVLSHDAISYFADEKIQLTSDQSNYIKILADSVESPTDKKHFYLLGPTGSGKTEVFLQATHEVIKKQKQVLYLVPEISLAHQCYPVFCKRFGKQLVAVLHSALTPSQRLTEWNKILNGEARVILGVRSAVFAPIKKLGLIVIDEEHDVSYKSDKNPRYHVRQIALKRSYGTGATVVMGSATPSIESWNYIQTGGFSPLELHNRVSGGGIASVELISLQNTVGIISLTLQKYIQQTLDNDFQVMLLMNRRGFSHMFLCTCCGHVISCPHCSVQLVLHQNNNGNILQCHHCGYKTHAPTSCPTCGYTSMSVRGWGIQRVEKEIQSLFPQHRIARFDSDIATNAQESYEIMSSFYSGDISILIGTQIIAKGINIPKLQLVGVVCADALFSLPDFRASERAMSLLIQASGRAGRFFNGGRVVIQTYMPEHPLLQALLTHSHDKFYRHELRRRQMFHFPPFSRILRLVFRGENQSRVIALAQEFVQAIEEYQKNTKQVCSILGPAECAIAKIFNKYRMHVILSARNQSTLIHLVHVILEHYQLRKKAQSRQVYIEIDPDALHMM